MENKASIWEKFILALVLYSVGMYFLELSFGSVNSLEGLPFFLWSERIVASILTIELFVRIKAGINTPYVKSIEFIFDVIAVLPFWLGFFVAPEYLAAVRSLRILRLLKFYRISPTAHMVVENLISQKSKLFLVNNFILIIVLFTGTLMHHLEAEAQPEAFGTLWNSIWWSVVTLTTVGYGDMSPVTPVGQAVTMVLMLTAIGIVGALISIVGSAFDISSSNDETELRLKPNIEFTKKEIDEAFDAIEKWKKEHTDGQGN